jgi:hypothetical protein
LSLVMKTLKEEHTFSPMFQITYNQRKASEFSKLQPTETFNFLPISLSILCLFKIT